MDIECLNAILDCCFGPDQGGAFPASLDMELWAGDPRLAGSSEISYPGYAAVAVSTTSNWTTPAAGGVKPRDVAVTFPAPTGEADDVATHWAMRNPGTSALYFVGSTGAEGLDITDAGPAPLVLPRVRAADALLLIA